LHIHITLYIYAFVALNILIRKKTK